MSPTVITAAGTILTFARLSQDAYSESGSGSIDGFRRLQGTTLGRWSGAGGSSFFASAYLRGQTGVVAIRGSAERKDWLDADVDLARLRNPISQLGDGFDFLGNARRYFEANGVEIIVVTGHSLGGALAQVLAARITTMPVAGVTYNAPGAAGLLGPVKLPARNAVNIVNIRSTLDPVSLRGTHLGSRPISIATKSPRLAGATGVDGLAMSALLDHRLGPLVQALQTCGTGAQPITWSPI